VAVGLVQVLQKVGRIVSAGSIQGESVIDFSQVNVRIFSSMGSGHQETIGAIETLLTPRDNATNTPNRTMSKQVTTRAYVARSQNLTLHDMGIMDTVPTAQGRASVLKRCRGFKFAWNGYIRAGPTVWGAWRRKECSNE
jgi:hypothetical protein